MWFFTINSDKFRIDEISLFVRSLTPIWISCSCLGVSDFLSLFCGYKVLRLACPSLRRYESGPNTGSEGKSPRHARRQELPRHCPPNDNPTDFLRVMLFGLPGFTHRSFSDLQILAAGETGEKSEQALQNLEITQLYIRGFFDKQLRGIKAPCWTERRHRARESKWIVSELRRNEDRALTLTT
jgi:hypothetical protein